MKKRPVGLKLIPFLSVMVLSGLTSFAHFGVPDFPASTTPPSLFHVHYNHVDGQFGLLETGSSTSFIVLLQSGSMESAGKYFILSSEYGAAGKPVIK